jgi:hypothetical protein
MQDHCGFDLGGFDLGGVDRGGLDLATLGFKDLRRRVLRVHPKMATPKMHRIARCTYRLRCGFHPSVALKQHEMQATVLQQLRLNTMTCRTMVRSKGLEPSRRFQRYHLKVVRLPIPPRPLSVETSAL